MNYGFKGPWAAYEHGTRGPKAAQEARGVIIIGCLIYEPSEEICRFASENLSSPAA